jgi:hypothetical protein
MTTMYDERVELIAAYRATPIVLAAMLRPATEAPPRRQARDAVGWTVLEVVCHLRDAEHRAFERVRRICETDRPKLESYDPDVLAQQGRYRDESPELALASFAGLRVRHAAYLEFLDPAQWQRIGVHAEAGEITVQQLTAHMAAHDVTHLAQIASQLD